MATQEFGIWSDAAGGFIETGFWSKMEAEGAMPALIAEGEDEDDLSALAICAEHEEQPADTCEECATDDDEESDDDE